MRPRHRWGSTSTSRPESMPRCAHRRCDGGERDTDRTRAENAAQENVAAAAPLLRACVTCKPSTRMAPSRTVRACGDHLRPSSTTRSAREDIHALSGMPETTTVEATFVFADIAGFTALTEAHGDHDAAA